ncbi:MAG: hypothetical protein KKE00_04100 [Proteobacteria bacterium]|nr:hypothetical protein [Pseudomonadota bacterium]
MDRQENRGKLYAMETTPLNKKTAAAAERPLHRLDVGYYFNNLFSSISLTFCLDWGP